MNFYAVLLLLFFSVYICRNVNTAGHRCCFNEWHFLTSLLLWFVLFISQNKHKTTNGKQCKLNEMIPAVRQLPPTLFIVSFNDALSWEITYKSTFMWVQSGYTLCKMSNNRGMYSRSVSVNIGVWWKMEAATVSYVSCLLMLQNCTFETQRAALPIPCRVFLWITAQHWYHEAGDTPC